MGDEDGRQRDSPRDCRAAPPHGRSRGRAHGPASCPPQRWSEVQRSGFSPDTSIGARRRSSAPVVLFDSPARSNFLSLVPRQNRGVPVSRGLPEWAGVISP